MEIFKADNASKSFLHLFFWVDLDTKSISATQLISQNLVTISWSYILPVLKTLWTG